MLFNHQFAAQHAYLALEAVLTFDDRHISPFRLEGLGSPDRPIDGIDFSNFVYVLEASLLQLA
jgi:hypothetical protein